MTHAGSPSGDATNGTSRPGWFGSESHAVPSPPCRVRGRRRMREAPSARAFPDGHFRSPPAPLCAITSSLPYFSFFPRLRQLIKIGSHSQLEAGCSEAHSLISVWFGICAESQPGAPAGGSHTLVYSAGKPAFSGGGGRGSPRALETLVSPGPTEPVSLKGSDLLSFPLKDQNPFIHPTNTLPGLQPVPGTVPGAGDTAVTRTRPCPHSARI